MPPSIQMNEVSKSYRLGKIGSGYFFREIQRVIQRLSSPVRATYQSSKVANTQVHALDDITLTITRGESVGIIGNNGSGKSTLLKLLAGVTLPSTGTIEIAGRVASLLEIGVGFQSDLSARENIFLNGAILGMSRSELKDRFESIVQFSGIERFLETPVKRFSSGMYIRLAFSIAIHCVADILLIDEILAVADRNFLDRCRKKLTELSNAKTTMLIVSHNLHTIHDLCTRTLLIADGKIVADGKTEQILNLYRSKKSR